jgi:transcriptional regulator with XRE-family HTH domain
MLPYQPTKMLDPMDLKKAYYLTNEDLAELLGLAVRTIDYYAAGRKVNRQIKLLCAFIHEEFQRQGIACNSKAIIIEESDG